MHIQGCNLLEDTAVDNGRYLEERRERGRPILKWVALIAALGLAIVLSQASFAANEVERGEYLVAAGGCVSCHTADGGEALAGGVKFETPFGIIYSTNITPDSETGIGGWSYSDFSNALRSGKLPNGDHLYPVFPYTNYTLMSDEDTAAMFSYLKAGMPVSYTPPDNDLKFPFNQRWLLGAWKWMFFDEERFVPDETQSEAWNRGAYLTSALGHCSACHTPRGFLGAENPDLYMTGATYREETDGRFLDWSSTNLTQSPNGLGPWSEDELTDYLKTGYSTQAGVFGPMNKVVGNSTSKLTHDDVRSMAIYLKSLPANDQKVDLSPPDEDAMRRGSILYDLHCGTCHQPNGLGSDTTGPPLVGSSVTLAPSPASLINVVLYGVELPSPPPSQEWRTKRRWQTKDHFYDKLTDTQAAELLTYTRNAWGNQGSVVTEEQIANQR
jgi:mono/diheme cytochrome c family protein